MKKLLLILFAFLAICAFGGAETLNGQKPVQQTLITYSSTNWTNKTRLLFLGNNVYVDTSSTGQAGQFKRIDNTADSCSNPFPLVGDTNGTIRPIWEYRLFETVRSVDKDSGGHTYRVQTRERVWDNSIKAVRWTPWTIAGKNGGYLDVTVQDSILVLSSGSTAKVGTYSLAFFLGSWARLCPDDAPGTANAAGDSVFADSSFVITR